MKVSVITISLNRGYEIEKTIQSVLAQTYQNLEYWVIDGGSTDETLLILEKYKLQLNFVTEKDEGIYHAMNKGIMKANGDYLIFLNAGDYFFSNSSLQTLIDNNKGEDLIYGDIVIKDAELIYLKSFPDILSFGFFLKEYLPHPATLIKKSLLVKTGLYNENNKIVSDWEFFMNAVCKFNASYKHVKNAVSVYYTGGISSLHENYNLLLNEREKVLKKHYSLFMEDYAELDQCRNEIQHLKNSRLHTITSALMRSSVYRLFKK